MVTMFFNGDIKDSIAKQLELNPLTAAVFSEVNPIPIKTALRLMDYNMGNFRLPLCEMEEATTANLIKQMKKFSLIKYYC
ncbi:4-hydroxy-tetrahydrodipicolinate synthase [bioreactor metagenome]|uniref:4-hydroxy-tetrahydrodipicolinate synthase n=1 Tax=bioreactor metagenome TaxID=1076179 RepID=A0A645IRJ9_9ZZZZ